MLAPIFAALLVTASPEDLDRTGSPYFLIEGTGNGKTEQFPLKETRARATIAGVIARVQVTQVYQNEGAEPIEAVYVFPGSTRSAVFAMRMKVGERTVEAKIEKRDAARQIYEKAIREGHTASLLEQQRPNVFQMNVGNILPGDRVEVVLDYSELLRPEEGIYQFVYPTVVGPRYVSATEQSSPWNENPYVKSTEKSLYKWSTSVRIAAGMPVNAVTSPTHQIAPRFEGKNTVSVESDDEHGGNRDFVLRYRLDGDAIETGLLLYEDTTVPADKGENYFLLMAQPPKRVAANAYVPREYIFVLDVSGSMSGFPLETAKTVMRGLLTGMKSGDSFNILFFSGGNSVLAEKSLPATRENIRRAMEMVEQQRGGGGTEILGALKRALALPRHEDLSTTIAVVTDGYVSVEKETYALVRSSLGKANLFAFGIGTSVNRAMIEAMARAGMGEPFFALNPTEAPERAEEFQRYIESPLLTGAKLSVEGFGAYDIEPPSLPDVFASRPMIVFGKYRGRAEGKIVIRGMDANGKFERVMAVSDAQPSDDLVALRYLWARDRIARLGDDLSIVPGDQEITSAITELGLKHHLMTEFTSFVAVDKEVRNVNGKPATVRQPLPEPQGVRMAGGEGKMGKKSRTIAAGAGVLGVLGASGHGGVSDAFGPGGLGSGVQGGIGGLGTRGAGSGGGGNAEGGDLGGGRGKSTTRVAGGQSIIQGSLDKDLIQRVIRSNLARIKYCYEKQLMKDPSLQGRVSVRFQIGADGSVVKAEISETTLNNVEVETCILKAMQSLRFPKPPGGGVVLVTYPFVFASG